MKKRFMAALMIAAMTVATFSNVSVNAAVNTQPDSLVRFKETSNISENLNELRFKSNAPETRENYDVTTVPHGDVGTDIMSLVDSKGTTQTIYYENMYLNYDQVVISLIVKSNRAYKDSLYGFGVFRNNGNLEYSDLVTVNETYEYNSSTYFRTQITLNKEQIKDKESLYLIALLGDDNGDVSNAGIVNIYNNQFENSYGFNVSYSGHVQSVGWQEPVKNGDLSGTIGEGLRVEGFKFNIQNPPGQLSIKYRAHVQNVGWQSWVGDGQIAGTTGKGLRVEGLQIKLEGEQARNYSVVYQAHVQYEGWQNWVQDGVVAGSEGEGKRVEAIRVKIVPKKNVPSVSYKTHIQNVGWQGYVSDGMVSGTVGKGLRLEAIDVKLANAPAGLKVKYRTHIQNVGWQEWKYNGDLSGTSGKGLRLEGIEIKLEGTEADKYSIEYQTQVQNVGWQPWVKDGQMAGTSGRGLRLESIKVRIVPKY